MASRALSGQANSARLKLRLAWVALLSEKMRGILFGKGCDPLVKRSHDLLNIRGQRQIWRWSSGRTPYFIFLICILPYFVAAHGVRPVGILTALMKQRASKWPRGASEAHFFRRPSDTFTESWSYPNLPNRSSLYRSCTRSHIIQTYLCTYLSLIIQSHAAVRPMNSKLTKGIRQLRKKR